MPTPAPRREALPLGKAARRLGVHRDTLRAAILRGEIPETRLGRRWLVPVATLDRILAVPVSVRESSSDEPISHWEWLSGPQPGSEFRPRASGRHFRLSLRTSLSDLVPLRDVRSRRRPPTPSSAPKLTVTALTVSAANWVLVSKQPTVGTP